MIRDDLFSVEARRELENAGRRIRRRRAHGVRPAQGPLRLPHVITLASNSERTLQRFFETVYFPRRLLTASPRTVHTYRLRIRMLNYFRGCEVTLDQLSDDLIADWQAWMIACGLSPVTANSYVTSILVLWRFAWRKRLIEELPRDVEKLPEPKRLPEAWSLEELSRILRAAAETAGNVGDVPAGRFWVMFVLVAYDTGLRLRSLRSIRTCDLDLEAGHVYLPAEAIKQKCDKLVDLHPETLAAIAATHPERRELLFETPWMSAASTYLRFKKVLARAGVSSGAIHQLRRTHGTFVYDAGGEDMALESLGHSDRQVMLRSYIDPRKLTRRGSAVDVLPRPTWRRPEPNKIPFPEETQSC